MTIKKFVIFLFFVYFSSCKKEKPYSVLFVGNSISKHTPNPEIGWYGNWGMAASDSTKDYIHILMDSIRNYKPDAIYSIILLNKFERRLELPDFLPYKDDLVIINLGENVKDSVALNSHIFELKFKELINRFSGKVVIVPDFWQKPNVTEKIKQAAKGHLYIDFSNITKGNMSYGKFENRGVAAHPSDKGMLEISQRIWKELKPIIIDTK